MFITLKPKTVLKLRKN